MISLEPISAQLVGHFRAARLAALEDTPTAFGSTLAKESQLSEQDWLQRVYTWNGSLSVCYIAMDEASPCGIAAGKCDDKAPQRAYLLSMWVAPAYRRSGLGTRLVNAVEEWVQNLGVRELRLRVTSKNSAAIRFYEGCGFVMTGETGPYLNDPALFEYEMAKSLGDLRSR